MYILAKGNLSWIHSRGSLSLIFRSVIKILVGESLLSYKKTQEQALAHIETLVCYINHTVGRTLGRKTNLK